MGSTCVVGLQWGDEAKGKIVDLLCDQHDVVVQRYLDRPYLIEGHKGHCRIYGLITSADPLRAYVYSELQ